jgi:PAS domain S-box-containing protein
MPHRFKKTRIKKTRFTTHFSSLATLARSATICLIPILVFILSSVFFIYSASRANDVQNSELEFKLLTEAEESSSTLKRELKDYEDVLIAAKGFFASREQSTRAEWDDFFATQELETRLPSLEALLYLNQVPVSQADAFTHSVQAEDLESQAYPAFEIFPTKEEGDYLIVDFIYPVESNEPLFGFDASIVPERAELFIQAEEKQDIIFTPPVYFEDEGEEQIGFLMLAPIYGNVSQGSSSDEPPELLGHVMTVIDTEILFESLQQHGIQAKVFDVTDGEPEPLWINNSQEEILNSSKWFGPPSLASSKTLQIGERSWEIQYQATESFIQNEKNQLTPLLILLGGIFISFLLALLIFNLETTKNRAISLAKILTRDLQDFKFALEGTAQSVIITGPDGVIQFANKAATKNAGYSLKEMIGATPSLWGGQMDEAFYKKMWKRILKIKKTFASEVLNKRKDGSTYDAFISISPILNEKKEVRLLIGFERDITKEKEIDLAKTEFVSLASHQLRSPLSTVNWYTETLLSGEIGKLNKTQKNYLQEIQMGGKNLSALVGDLLNVSRLELGTFVPDPIPIKLKPFIEGIMHEHKALQKKNQLKLKLIIAKNVPQKIMIDKKIMSMVLHNLFTNAMKYSPNGGSVKLKVEKLTSKKAKLKTSSLLFTISDHGIGIPKAQQHRLFTKMFRAQNAQKTEFSGTGLGLYMIKMMIEHLGGSIHFESEENKGSTFFVEIPTCRSAARPSGSKSRG